VRGREERRVYPPPSQPRFVLRLGHIYDPSLVALNLLPRPLLTVIRLHLDFAQRVADLQPANYSDTGWAGAGMGRD